MPKLLPFAILLAGFVCTSSCSRRLIDGETHLDNVEIYYLPIRHETFSPVTRQTIRRESNCRIRATATEFRNFFQDARNKSTNAPFDERVVRIEIIGPVFLLGTDRHIFVDQSGGLAGPIEDRRSRLPQEDLKKLDEMLARLASDQGCKTY